MRKLILSIIFCLNALPALAENDFFPPVRDALTKKECGACHMAFQAGLLPAASWSKIMKSLDNHFGEDASLDEAAGNHIEAYLTANAGHGRGAPLRITELRWFAHEHQKRGLKRLMKKDNIKLLADCAACHSGAARGAYEDD